MISVTSALIGLGISFAALALSVLALVLRIGKLIGKLEAGMLRNGEDIGKLWEHQRSQDKQLNCVGQAISEINTNIEWIKNALGGTAIL